ncbi:hypothetical protein Desaf_2451 [Desulfocurvibacter africanus subsp. africanus str. Walvis Bay]|uniref:Uncharacterized protein n=1 Tax=Desulfocurvibacter africanus subsp. africanus str. Walvis Bay TaxID=690850 RepID=F3YYM0_DESAF|nr:hypothetical protein Desaf_2451 [Desulfocurvibacter africanus subsp. africanus str. Walvis Bay]
MPTHGLQSIFKSKMLYFHIKSVLLNTMTQLP